MRSNRRQFSPSIRKAYEQRESPRIIIIAALTCAASRHLGDTRVTMRGAGRQAEAVGFEATAASVGWLRARGLFPPKADAGADDDDWVPEW